MTQTQKTYINQIYPAVQYNLLVSMVLIYSQINNGGKEMNYTSDIFTKDMARRIYYDLSENSSGQIPFDDFKVHYILNRKDENNKPLEVEIEIINEKGEEVHSYLLKYEDGFADFRVIQGNRIVKR